MEDSRPVTPSYLDQFFEGPEKLFEIIFKPVQNATLRGVPKEVWVEVLKVVKCEIVNTISNSVLDAHLLSLILYSNKMLIKTCGTTTLLLAVPLVLEIARSLGFTEIESVFYTRKNFLQPEKQLFPHGNFHDEVKFLESAFDNGRAHILGNMNEDHLYIYHVGNPQNYFRKPDQTLEILMHEIDQEACKMFYREEDFTNPRATTMKTGIFDLFAVANPINARRNKSSYQQKGKGGLIIDDWVFDPCGYSLNAIDDDSYYTIHVTPQSEFSFASFETNVSWKYYPELIKRVVEIFRPGRFSVSVAANNAVQMQTGLFDIVLPGYHRDENAKLQLPAYCFTYAHFIKPRCS